MQYKTRHILSAFQNGMDWDKVERFTQELIEADIFHDFPPIKGFETIIEESDFGKQFICGEDEIIEVTEEHLGMVVWVVTDGHHRAFAFNRALDRTGLTCFNWIETEDDVSCYV